MNYKKFGDLTREEQVKLFEAWLEDENCIVFLSKADVGVWLSCHTPSWSPLNTYRVKETPDSINWDHVHPDFKWMARNSHGKTLLFCNQQAQSVLKTLWLRDQNNLKKGNDYE